MVNPNLWGFFSFRIPIKKSQMNTGLRTKIHLFGLKEYENIYITPTPTPCTHKKELKQMKSP